MRKRALIATVLFAFVGLVGPLLYWFGANFYLVSGFWPTWILGVYEYSLGKVWAGVIATLANVVVFASFGIVAAMVRSRKIYFVFCAVMLVLLGYVGYWIHGGNWISFVIFILLFAILFFALDFLLKEAKGVQVQ